MSENTAYHVIPYSFDALTNCFVENSEATYDTVVNKLHLAYFSEYFTKLEAGTIVVEKNYVDHDYLEDYAAYYVRCFERYERNTKRLHFFSKKFSEQQFRECLTNSDAALSETLLQKHYIGFVVVKPLPKTIIGRTCLQTYLSDNGRREFPILREFSVSLFGLSLKIDSLAYQEQDTVVAACATSALWSCFQGSGKLFQHAIPSPVEITKAATRHVPENLPANSARALPNAGLTATQMAIAIRDVGLEPYILGTSDPYVLNVSMYAYLRGKIPSVLTFSLIDVLSDKKDDWEMGAHAVTVTGYSLGKDKPEPGRNGLLLRASRIDRLYAHDDQVGPFSRMVWHQSPRNRSYLKTSWKGEGSVEAIPTFLMLPLYHKIRIPFEIIHDAIQEVDFLIEAMRHGSNKTFPNLERPEWDIYLTTVSEFKDDVLKLMRPLLGTRVEKTLTADLPRFLWRATARCRGESHLELLFDATGIAQHKLLVHAVELKREIPELITAYAISKKKYNLKTSNEQADAIFDWFSPTH